MGGVHGPLVSLIFARNVQPMLLIGEVLVSDDIIQKQFVCNLNACKGACCWEGDFGAPLEEEECSTLEAIYDQLDSYLLPEGRAAIQEQGPHTINPETGGAATPLLPDGPCAYLTYDDDGIAKCGIEKAWQAGAVDFQKPISCHLYPVRVVRGGDDSFEGLNYDQWDICSAACSLGKTLQVPVYQFVKDALVRKYGEDFFEELDAAAKHLG